MTPDRRAYETRGFTELGPILDTTVVAELKQALDGWLGREPAKSAYGVLRNNVWARVPEFERALRASPLARLAAELTGEEGLVLFQDNVIWKPPGTVGPVEWHQDFAYWPLDRPRGVTLWIALDDATVENGCLHYVPGTHREGERAATDFIAGTNQPRRSDLPPLDPRGREVVAMPIVAGSALAHDPLVWHTSPGNRTQGERRAWSLTLVSPSVRWDPDHAPHPFNWELRPAKGTALEGALFPRL